MPLARQVLPVPRSLEEEKEKEGGGEV